MEELEIRILPMSKKEFCSYTIPNQVATIEEIQKNFFIKSLKENKEKVYKFKKVYLKTTKNSLVLFQYDNQLIASALYKGVNIFKEDSEDFKNGYFGSYIFDKDSIKIFSPISNKEFQEIKEKIINRIKLEWNKDISFQPGDPESILFGRLGVLFIVLINDEYIFFEDSIVSRLLLKK